MSRIRGSDTKIELVARRALHAQGLRYRLGGAGLPGRPDLVFPRHKTVLFVHGCFWHKHDCHLFRLPKTRPDFWKDKLTKNRARDLRAEQKLEDLGWRVLILWECALRGRPELEQQQILREIATEIRKRQQ